MLISLYGTSVNSSKNLFKYGQNIIMTRIMLNNQPNGNRKMIR